MVDRPVHEVRVLSDRHRAALRAAPSYHTAVVAFRLSVAGLALAGLFAVVVNLVGMPKVVVGPVSVVFALVFLPTLVVTAINLTRTSILRFNLRGRQLIDPMGKRQFYAMFLADVFRGPRRTQREN